MTTRKTTVTVVNRNSKFIVFSVSDFEKNRLSKLQSEIGEQNYNTIIKTENFLPGGVIPENHQSREQFGIFFLIKDEYIILLALGEFQPGRDMVILESIWKK